MSTRSDTIQAISQEGAVNAENAHKSHVGATKEKGIIGKVKNLIGKVVVVDEDWILKSKDWPYMWNHKEKDDKA